MTIDLSFGLLLGAAGFVVGFALRLLTIGRWVGRADAQFTGMQERFEIVIKGLEQRIADILQRIERHDMRGTVGRHEGAIVALQRDVVHIDRRVARLEGEPVERSHERLSTPITRSSLEPPRS